MLGRTGTAAYITQTDSFLVVTRPTRRISRSVVRHPAARFTALTQSKRVLCTTALPYHHRRSCAPTKSALVSRHAWQPSSYSLYTMQKRAQSTNPNLDVVGSSLIPTINKLQEIFALTGTSLDLPQIVVIGGQSSGKSSVLENLVGRDFLPRGSGIVTRRPLILQLQTLEKGEKEYGEFLHKPGEKFYDFQKIKAEISAETDRVCGKNAGISTKAILLKVYSPHVLPLTLVDTPGMARVATGDQPSNIEDQIRNLVSEYIFKPNSIILAVQSGNQDLATSDALHLAKTADPEGNRTLGVLTKLDLMDKGTDVMSVLMGRSFPLKKGWIALVNRSQADINNDVPINVSRKAEDDFFGNHHVYKLVTERCGTKALAERCSKLLSAHIKQTLPQLRSQISQLIKQRQEELELYGAPAMEDEAGLQWLLLQLINNFSAEYTALVQGNSVNFQPSASTQTENSNSDSEQQLYLSGGARIRYIFKEKYSKKMEKIKHDQGLTTEIILNVIKNAAGTKPALFVPDRAFEVLAQKQIGLLRQPSLQVAESIFNELSRVLTEVREKDVGRFYKLREAVLDVGNDVLRKKLKETLKLINTLIQIELSYINTNHPDFIGMKMSLTQHETDDHKEQVSSESGGVFSFFSSSTPSKKSDADSQYEEVLRQISNREKQQVQILSKLLENYFEIVKKNVLDSVTKSIMLSLVNGVTTDLQKELVKQLYNGDTNKYRELLQEAGDVETKRHVARTELEALKKAKKVIQMSEIVDLPN